METGLEMNLSWSEASSRGAFEAGSCRVAANTSQRFWGVTCLPAASCLPDRIVIALTHTPACRLRGAVQGGCFGCRALKHLIRCIRWEVLERKEKPPPWGREPQQLEALLAQPQQSDTDVYKARLKHLRSPNKQERVMDAGACRLQGRARGQVRWPHPEDMAGGGAGGDTELGCLLEEEAGMMLLGEHV